MSVNVDLLTFIIAAIALVQPGMIFLWKKYLKRPKIEFHETGKIELGYSELGPTMALIVTCRATNGDVFVKNLDVKVERIKNKSQYDFSVLAFRSTVLDVTNMTSINFEVPSGFLVRPDRPVTVYPVFNDKETQKELQATKDVYTEKVYEHQESHFAALPGSVDSGNTDAAPTEFQKSQFAEIIRQKDFHTQYYTKADRAFYWEPGEYRLTLSVQTAEKRVSFSRAYKFSINAKDSEFVKLNVVKIVHVTLDAYMSEPERPWRFIYSDYQST